MPRTCTICTHKKRAEIDQALVNGESYREITGRFPDTKKSSLERHKAHISKALTEAKHIETVEHAGDLLDMIQARLKKTDDILSKVDGTPDPDDPKKKPVKSDYKTALLALRESRGYLELLAKARGELEPEGMIKIQVVVERENFLIEILMEAIRAEADPETTRRIIEHVQQRRAGLNAAAASKSI